MSTIIFAVIGVVALLAGLLLLRREKQEVVEAVGRMLEQEGNASDDFDPYAYSNSGEIVGVKVESGPLEEATVKESSPVQVVKESLTTDGWIPWEGGECPVPKGALVDVRFRCGAVNPHQKACVWWWTNTGGDYDIVAYRLPSIEQRPMAASMEAAIAETGEWLRTPERDNCQLIPRDELARLQEAYSIGVRYCKNPASQSNFERLARAHGVEL